MDSLTEHRAVARLEAYIESQARPLERALLHHRRAPGSGTAAAVVAALIEYRNPDGGFGRGLEPDYRARASSALATNIALRTVIRLQDRAPLPQGIRDAASREIVEPALAWLESALDRGRSVWPIVGQSGDAEPHAPWWTAAKLEESFDGFLLNPSAECAAHLIRFGDERQRELGLSLAPIFIERAKAGHLTNGDALACMSVLAACPGLAADAAAAAALKVLLPAVVAELVMRDEARWSEYCLRPYRAVPSPDAPGADALRPLVLRSLDWLVERQDADGSLAPNWSWFGLFPETWPQAEREWRGWLALEAIEIIEAWYLG